jgi:hypothetical protein
VYDVPMALERRQEELFGSVARAAGLQEGQLSSAPISKFLACKSGSRRSSGNLIGIAGVGFVKRPDCRPLR